MEKQDIHDLALAATKGRQRCSLAISMGVGKTLIGLKHMDELYKKGCRKFLVVAPKISIFATWKEEAEKFGYSDLLSCITFSTYRSLNKQPFNYHGVYLDECHSLLSNHDYWLMNYKGIVLGLTGTAPRHQNSEKGKLFKKHCPIVYKYDIDEAIDDEILNNYTIYVHKLKLNPNKELRITMKDGKSFTTSELDSYKYYNDKLQKALDAQRLPGVFNTMRVNGEEIKNLRLQRMRTLQGFTSKELYARRLFYRTEDKCLVFCNTKEQASRLCNNVYYSGNKDNPINLENFQKGTIKKMAAVAQLNEGINIPELKVGIVLHAYSNERKLRQRLGRFLRLNPNDNAIIHILMYEDTADEEWVMEALQELDASKIIFVKT